jgi:hypothetical protein
MRMCGAEAHVESSGVDIDSSSSARHEPPCCRAASERANLCDPMRELILLSSLATGLALGESVLDVQTRPAVERGARSDEGVERWLSELSAARAQDRSRAERELAARLGARDLDRLRAAAQAGTAEVRRRIAAALGADEPHIDLAASMASDRAPEISEIGRDALRELIARWSPGYSDPGLERGEVRLKLREKSERVFSLDASANGADLALALDELDRAAESAPPLVLDPALAISAPRAFHPNTDFEGPLERVLDGLARANDVGFVGFAFDAELGASARPWILVTSRADDGTTSAVERITAWCVAIAEGPDAQRTSSAEIARNAKRSAAARALAAIDWPAALVWLEQRWRGGADADALDGVLLAAGRGRVVGSLLDPRVQESLYAEMDAAARRRDSAGDRRAEEIARALAEAGSSGAAGEDLSAVALSNRGASARETWMRLVVLELTKSASPLVLPFVDALIASPPASEAKSASESERDALRFQALRTRAACAHGQPSSAPLADPRSLFEWAAARGELDELVRCLAVSSAAFPTDWRDPDRWPNAWWDESHDALRAALVAWSLAAPKSRATTDNRAQESSPAAAEDVAAKIASRAMSPAFIEALAGRFRRAIETGDGDRVERFVAAARRASPSSESLDRLEVLSGRDGAEAEARVIDAATSDSRSDLLCLGAMAGGRLGAKARESLVRSIRGKPAPEDLIAALDRAIVELRAARAEKDEHAFVLAVRDAAKSAEPKVRALLRADLWPEVQKSVVVHLSEVDRHLRTSGL